MYRVPFTLRRKLLFWLAFLLETLTSCRLSRLVQIRLGREWLARVEGVDELPISGSFVLAVNHYKGGAALDVVAAVIAATKLVRPDLVDRYLIIVGKRERTRAGPLPLVARLVSSIVNYVYKRWSGNAVRITLDNGTTSIRMLREWRSRVRDQPVLVFPEGKAQLQFATIRPGAGHWLALLGVPVAPVGVWWQDKGWHVRFNAPIKWSHRSELHDAQLGLAIANLLPAPLATGWQQPLEQWRGVHQD